jgi:hypothetical protein
MAIIFVQTFEMRPPLTREMRGLTISGHSHSSEESLSLTNSHYYRRWTTQYNVCFEIEIGITYRMHMIFWWETQKESGQYEDLDVSGSIILKWILET